jgi:hypothetical protein
VFRAMRLLCSNANDVQQILRTIQEHTDLKFNFQDHLLGGVRVLSRTPKFNVKLTYSRLLSMPLALP